ncbi:unnamed protein product [Anisakis simplex]|uniref:Uncharacterized protein n=1 Tax=Anisakis simplex TaxID=6269 RepID=A0A0M3J2V6_ANISI|nr:unnamed protein product [Anisakis simplex]
MSGDSKWSCGDEIFISETLEKYRKLESIQMSCLQNARKCDEQSKALRNLNADGSEAVRRNEEAIGQLKGENRGPGGIYGGGRGLMLDIPGYFNRLFIMMNAYLFIQLLIRGNEQLQ